MKQKTQNLKLFGREFIQRKIICLILLSFISVLNSSCRSENTDLRSLAPKDTIIYLETKNLGETLNALTESKSFKEKSATKTDFSIFDEMQIAIAVTDFQTSEKQVTDQQSVLNFKPAFTAIAETNAWSWQVNSLVENNLNNFILKIYGSNAKLERKSLNDTERFVWTANDGRKTFAVISGTQVFFGNNEESLNKCLLAKRGETESLLKNESLSLEYEKSKGKLAFGFISKDGIKQIADLVGVSVAVGQTDDADSRGFISKIIPQILNNTIGEITWTAEKNDQGIEDQIFVRTEKEVSEVFSETLIPADKKSAEIYEFLPSETFSVTRYNLKNPQIAFRSLLLVTAKNTDAVSSEIIYALSNSLLASYGITNAEEFLSAADSHILTARLDESGDKKFAVVKVKDIVKIKESLSEKFDFNLPAMTGGKAEIWTAKDEEELAAAFEKNYLIIGEKESVYKSIAKSQNNGKFSGETKMSFAKNKFFSQFIKSNAIAVTVTKDLQTTEKIVNVLGKSRQNSSGQDNYSLTETYFSKRGIRRKYVSDFGFLGTIVEQFNNQ